MNSLSIFIYLASITGGISRILGLGGGFIIAVVAVWWIYTALYNVDRSTGFKPGPTKQTFIMVPMAFFLFFLAILVPNKETLYLIAGSEVGERVVSSSEAKAMMSDIQEVIRQQLNNLKEPSK